MPNSYKLKVFIMLKDCHNYQQPLIIQQCFPTIIFGSWWHFMNCRKIILIIIFNFKLLKSKESRKKFTRNWFLIETSNVFTSHPNCANNEQICTYVWNWTKKWKIKIRKKSSKNKIWRGDQLLSIVIVWHRLISTVHWRYSSEFIWMIHLAIV
jgi:hypothetical protein